MPLNIVYINSRIVRSPVDMSALGQKRTIGDAIHQGLQDALVGAQIDVMKSEARKNKRILQQLRVFRIKRKLTRNRRVNIQKRSIIQTFRSFRHCVTVSIFYHILTGSQR
jgi:hypothetical protein